MKEYSKDIIYQCVQQELHEFVPMVIELSQKYNVDAYLIMAIFKFELSKHPKLVKYKNLGNIRSEDTEFMLPIQYDDARVSTEYYIRLMSQALEKNKIYTIEDVKNFIRPFDPDWGDMVSEYYEEMIKMSRGEEI